MVNAIRPNSGLSAWENDACLACGRTVADRTRAICDCGSQLPRPVVRSRDGSMRLVTGFHSSYRRMSPNLPAATITTASGHLGSDRTIHPYENRVLSPLECALLQTFPLTFKWGDSLREWGHTNVRAMIGEAVPPLFTRRHGRLLASILQGSGPVKMMSATDQRVLAAEAALKRGEKFK
jgi:DNA (cytosine-5)-methyltransferase 1